MGNSTSRVVGCFAPFGNGNEAVDLDFLEPLDEGLGHSFCYVRPDSPVITPSNSERFMMDSSTLDGDTNSGSFRQEVLDDPSGRPSKNFSETTFKTISGASVSANVSTARTGNPNLLFLSDAQEPAASFESTASFAAIPLQPVPRGSGPLNGFMSGPLERGYASGPLEKGRGYMSGPLDKGLFMSGPLESADRSNFSAPLSYGKKAGLRGLMRTMSRPMKSAFSRTFAKNPPGSSWIQRFFVQPMTQFVWHAKESKFRPQAQHNGYDIELSEKDYSDSRHLQWAHGKAGEDRVHVVLSEEQGWLFIGIYDGFSGPDAPDFLMSNLYRAIDRELEGLLWDYEDKFQPESPTDGAGSNDVTVHKESERGESHITDCSVGRSEDGHESEALHAYLNDYEKTKVSVEHQKSGDVSAEIPVESETNDSGIILEGAAAMDQDDDNMNHESMERSNGPLMPPVRDHSSISSTTLPGNAKKSVRLFELLQIELMEDHDRGFSLSDIGSRGITSCSMRTSESKDLHLGESLHASERYPCSPRTQKVTTNSLRLDADMRENHGASCTESNDLGKKTSTYAAANLQIMKHSLIGSKLRRFYMKKKLLRKKLFPWSYDWHRQHINVDGGSVGPAASIRRCKSGPVDHDAVLQAMSRALKCTEEAYMDMVEKTLDSNPELALMGSCVLVMLMKDQDVYVMNVGDSRVILAQERLSDRYSNSNPVKDDPKPLNRSRESLVRVELDRISEDSPMHNPNCKVGSVNKDQEISIYRLKLRALQLSTDHCTSIEEEVRRIKTEHIDDVQSVFNDRVKGQLKVTRAFGAGFLKKPEFNEALLEMFRIDYIGDSPYLSCVPSVLHHRLCASDRFLVLSSDGLYQYFSNEEVVSHVAWFIENVPDGDPAQYLIAELLFRAAKKNGMDFHELLDIPHGDRRKYHDDVSVMVVSLEGRIWRSCG